MGTFAARFERSQMISRLEAAINLKLILNFNFEFAKAIRKNRENRQEKQIASEQRYPSPSVTWISFIVDEITKIILLGETTVEGRRFTSRSLSSEGRKRKLGFSPRVDIQAQLCFGLKSNLLA